jgi:hypothetical protein
LKRSGAFTAPLGIGGLKLSAGKESSRQTEDQSQDEESLAVTAERTFSRSYDFEYGDEYYIVARYRRRTFSLYLEFEDHLEIRYVTRRSGIGLIRELSPRPVAGAEHWRTKNENVVDRGFAPLGAVSYWEQLERYDLRPIGEYACQVERPHEVTWSPPIQPIAPTISIDASTLDNNDRSLYSLLDPSVWKLRRPPRRR